MNQVKYLVVHCSDSPQWRGDTASTIHDWHKEKGWDGIGYHAVILENGTIQYGRPVYWPGSHVWGHNSHSLGVCLIGRGGDATEEQLDALRICLVRWKANNLNAAVVGHRDLDDKKTCPGFDVKKWWEGTQCKPRIVRSKV